MNLAETEIRYLPLRLPLGTLDGELTLPVQSKALILIPHALSFRTDTELHRTLSDLHQQGLATWLFNLHHLQDHQSDYAINTLQWITHRLVEILQIKRHYLSQGMLPAKLPFILSTTGMLVAPAIRAAVIQDQDTDVLMCHCGLLGDAGQQYLNAFAKPIFHSFSKPEEQLLGQSIYKKHTTHRHPTFLLRVSQVIPTQ